MLDCLIIGGGPCGVSTAIYLKRAGYDVAIIEKSFIGGQVGYSSELANYAGFIEKDAFVFCNNMTKQLKELEIPVLIEKVIKVSKNSEQNFEVQTNKNSHFARCCILCIGAESRNLGLVKEKEYQGKGVSYCAVCDGSLYRKKNVLVVGGGNSAFEDAIYLSKICNKVTLINRSEKFKAEKYLQKNLFDLSLENGGNVEILTNAVLKDLEGNDGVEKAIISLPNKDISLDVQGVFIAIGREPDSKFLLDTIELDRNYVNVDENFKTNIEGVFAGGDCIPKKLRQVVTAVSDGASIAKSVADFLQ